MLIKNLKNMTKFSSPSLGYPEKITIEAKNKELRFQNIGPIVHYYGNSTSKMNLTAQTTEHLVDFR